LTGRVSVRHAETYLVPESVPAVAVTDVSDPEQVLSGGSACA
jgi:hypothetical protein